MWNCLQNKTTNDVTDTVANNNMNSVTSNAVAQEINNLQNQINGKAGGDGHIVFAYFTPQQFSDVTYLSSLVRSQPVATLIIFMIGWEDYTLYPYYGISGYIMVSRGSAYAYGAMRDYAQPTFQRAFYWIDEATPDRFSGVYNLS